MIDVPRRDLKIMFEAGYIYLGMGKLAEAKQIFAGLTLLAPQSEVPWVAQANVFFAQRNYLQSIRTLKEAVALNDKSALAWSYLGESLLFYDKKAEGIVALDRAVALDPQGESGKFAQALKDLIHEGFDPKIFRENFKKREAEMKKAQVQSPVASSGSTTVPPVRGRV